MPVHLDPAAFHAAYNAYCDCPCGSKDSVAVAIQTYVEETRKPGQVQMLEPLEAIPQRDYRKELWIGIRLQDADIAEANAALADFDKTFPKENHHG